MVFWLLWVLRNILVPFIIGLILAYLLLPPMLWIEKRLPRRYHLMQTKRILIIIFLYLVVVAAIGIAGYFLVPVIVNSISDFISNLPTLIPDLIQRFQDWTELLRQSLPVQIQDQLNTYLANLVTTIVRCASISSGVQPVPYHRHFWPDTGIRFPAGIPFLHFKRC